MTSSALRQAVRAYRRYRVILTIYTLPAASGRRIMALRGSINIFSCVTLSSAVSPINLFAMNPDI